MYEDLGFTRMAVLAKRNNLGGCEIFFSRIVGKLSLGNILPAVTLSRRILAMLVSRYCCTGSGVFTI